MNEPNTNNSLYQNEEAQRAIVPRQTAIKVRENVRTLAAAHEIDTPDKLANDIGVSVFIVRNLLFRCVLTFRTLRLIQMWAIRKQPECLGDGN